MQCSIKIRVTIYLSDFEWENRFFSFANREGKKALVRRATEQVFRQNTLAQKLGSGNTTEK